MTLVDANDAVDIVRSAAGDNDINVIFGVSYDESLGDRMFVTVIATEFIGSDMHRIENKIYGNNQARGVNSSRINNTISKLDPSTLKTVKQQPEIENLDEKNDKEPNIEDTTLIPSFLRKKRAE